jgi:hypothetical protein
MELSADELDAVRERVAALAARARLLDGLAEPRPRWVNRGFSVPPRGPCQVLEMVETSESQSYRQKAAEVRKKLEELLANPRQALERNY